MNSLNINVLRRMLADAGFTYPTPILERRLGLLAPAQAQSIAKLFAKAQRASDESVRDQVVEKIDRIIAAEAEKRQDPWVA